MNNLVTHHIAGDNTGLAPGSIYTYHLAGNGVFIAAKRDVIAVQFNIAYCEVRGLPALEEEFEITTERVPVGTVEEMLRRARQEALADLEILFHLTYDDEWNLIVPNQEADRVSCRPTENGPDSSHGQAIIECHSHHNMTARFSFRDDEDEREGFRIYAVLGQVLTEPEINVRVGMHGYFWPIPAEWVFEMPEGLEDVNNDETENYDDKD